MLEHNVGKESKRRRIGSGRGPLSSNLDQKVFEFLRRKGQKGNLYRTSFSAAWLCK